MRPDERRRQRHDRDEPEDRSEVRRIFRAACLRIRWLEIRLECARRRRRLEPRLEVRPSHRSTIVGMAPMAEGTRRTLRSDGVFPAPRATYSPRYAASASCASGTVFSGLILYHACSMFPSSSTRNDERMIPTYVLPPYVFSPHAPHAVATSWSVSASSGNPSEYFSSKASCLSGSSGDMPTTSTPSPANSCR